MKRLFIILSIICIFILITALSTKPLLIIFTKGQLEKVFPSSQVSVGDFVVSPISGIKIINISIKREKVYDIKIKEADIKYDFKAIPKTGFLKLCLKDPVIYFHTSNKPVCGMLSYLNVGNGKPIFKSVEVKNLALDLRTADLVLEASLDSKVNAVAMSPDYLNLRIGYCSISGVSLEDSLLNFSADAGKGNFSIALLKYDKLNINDIKGIFRFQDAWLLFNDVSAKALNGELKGDLGLEIKKEIPYFIELNVRDLEIEKFIRDFKLEEKAEMSGRLSGELKLKGRGVKIDSLAGSFSTLPPGGVLVIKDDTYLKNMAEATSQPLSLLVENFKNYRYNIGQVGLGAEGSNVILNISLEGEAGKRQLSVVFHDFKLGYS